MPTHQDFWCFNRTVFTVFVHPCAFRSAFSWSPVRRFSTKTSNLSLRRVYNNSTSAKDVHQSLEPTSHKSSSKLLNSNNVTVRRSVASKFSSENLNPCIAGSSLGARTSSKIKHPLQTNYVIKKQSESFTNNFDDSDFTCTENTDSKIESIEKEIDRLKTRLEYICLEKMKWISSKSAVALKQGRFVAAKFMDPTQPPLTGTLNPRKLESKTAKQKTTLGRKAISLGPAEIYSTIKLKKPGNRPEFTPVSRRKPCFWRAERVDELKLSPKPGKSASKLQSGYSKLVVSVKEDEFISSIQPKELFKEVDKSVTAKKKRCGRMVSSRYICSYGGQAHTDSSATNGSRKRSLSDCDSAFLHNQGLLIEI